MMQIKRYVIIWLVFAHLLGSCAAQEKVSNKLMPSPSATKIVSQSEHVSTDYVGFASLGIKLRQPKGFEKSSSFDGFGQSATQSAVLAVNLIAPFSKISAGFNQKTISSAGMDIFEQIKCDC